MVTPLAVSLGFVLNVGTADSDQTGSTRDVVVTPVPRPRMVIEKFDPVLTDDADGSGDISAGDTLTYTVTVTNTGTANLTNVVVSDDRLTPSEEVCLILGPGISCTLVGTYEVTEDDVAAGEIENAATGDSDQTEVITTPPIVTPIETPDLEIVKELTGGSDVDLSEDISEGDILEYTLTATNTGGAALTNVTITDSLTGQTLPCSANLAAGDSCSVTVQYTVTADDVERGFIVNIGTADSEQTVPVRDIVVTPVPFPGLIVVKELGDYDDLDGSGDISEGDVLQYTVTATDTGTSNLTSVVVTDPMLSPSEVTCDLLEPGGTCVLAGTYVVTPADVAAGAIENTGTAGSDQTDEVESIVVTPLPYPDLDVVKTDPTLTVDADGSGDISVGDTLHYTITATNTGTAVLTNVVVSDSLTGEDTTCSPLAPGETCVLEVDYDVQPGALVLGAVVNIGAADSDQTGSTRDIVVTPVPCPDMTIVKTLTDNADEDGSGDVSAGDTLTYTVTATNTGTANLTDVVVTDLLTGDTTTCALVVPGGTCTLEVTYVVTEEDVAAGEVVNTATGDSDQTEVITTPPVVTPVPFPDMTIVKLGPANLDEDGSGDVSVGDTLFYAVIATNAGTANLTDVVVSDDLLTPSETTCTVLAPGERCTLIGRYTVTAADVENGTIANIGAGDSDQTEVVVTPPVVTPVPSPDLTVVKSDPMLVNDADGSFDISAGDTLSYTITATNTGTANLTNVVVTDPMLSPSEATCDLLEPGDTCVLTGTYIVTPADVDAGMVENTGTAGGDQTDEVESIVVTPLPFPELTVVKGDPALTIDADGSGDMSAGDTITYTVTAINTGTAILTGVVVSDSKIEPSVVRCELLLPGAECVLEGTYVVTPEDVESGRVANIAAGDSDQIGAVITPPVVTPLPEPGLTIVKSFPVISVDADGSGDITEGDTLSYTITATNVGEATLTNVVVTDSMITPSSVTCAELDPGETCVLTGSYVVTHADVVAGSIVNTATADSDQTGGVSDRVTVPLAQLPATGAEPAGTLRLAALLVMAGIALALARGGARRVGVRAGR